MLGFCVLFLSRCPAPRVPAGALTAGWIYGAHCRARADGWGSRWHFPGQGGGQGSCPCSGPFPSTGSAGEDGGELWGLQVLLPAGQGAQPFLGSPRPRQHLYLSAYGSALHMEHICSGCLPLTFSFLFSVRSFQLPASLELLCSCSLCFHFHIPASELQDGSPAPGLLGRNPVLPWVWCWLLSPSLWLAGLASPGSAEMLRWAGGLAQPCPLCRPSGCALLLVAPAGRG